MPSEAQELALIQAVRKAAGLYIQAIEISDSAVGKEIDSISDSYYNMSHGQ